MLKKGIIFSLFAICLMFPVFVYAYTGGSFNYHIEMTTSELGAITVYIPYNYADCFSIENNKIINHTQSTINGYIAGVNGTIRFLPFTEKPQYQTQYQWSELTITSIIDYNIPILHKMDFPLFSMQRLEPYLYIALFLVVICSLFIHF